MQDHDTELSTDESLAHELDQTDTLKSFRSQFFIPVNKEGQQKIYFSGNSLGLQPKTTPETMQRELHRWQTLGTEAHFNGDLPWIQFQEPLRNYLTSIVGASTSEIILMNGLTVNIHLMLASFYQPTAKRYKILISDPAFPSDRYAVKSFLRMQGYDPADAIVYWRPGNTRHILDMEDLQDIMANQGEEIALVWLEGVNYLSGQAMDMQQITALGARYGCKVGFDLAHTAGNIPLQLHDWGVDFAAWCSYKYLNGGPGAIAGCYVHEKYFSEPLTQLAGWYGTDPKTRFRFEEDFVPDISARRFQISNPPIFSMIPLHDSLALFEQATMPALRTKSLKLTQYLRFLIESLEISDIKIVTPARQGCQLSLAAGNKAPQLVDKLRSANVSCDLREPDIIRMAPVPLYNSYHDAWKVAQIIKQIR